MTAKDIFAQYRITESTLRNLIRSDDHHLNFCHIQNGWKLIVSPKGSFFIANDEGDVVYLFPDKSSILNKANEGIVQLSDGYLVDFNKRQIVSRELVKVCLNRFVPLYYENTYDDAIEIVQRSVVWQNLRLLPRKPYDSFDVFASSNWLIIVGKIKNDYSVFLLKLQYWYEKTVKDTVRLSNIVSIRTDHLSWVEKQYGLTRRRYPLLSYTNHSGETCVLIGSKQLCLPSQKFSIAVVYDNSLLYPCRVRLDWSRVRQKQEDVILDDFGPINSDIDSLVICCDHQMFNTDGSVFHSFDLEMLFVDSWFEYIAYSFNNQIRIFELISAYQLTYRLGEEKESVCINSPMYGSITGFSDYEVFGQRVWDICFKGSEIVVIDSLGNEIPMRLSKQICNQGDNFIDVFNRRKDFLVLFLGNGEYALVLKDELIIIEASYTIFDADNRYLDIGSRYECFDLENKVFAPVPWINKVVSEDEKEEWKRKKNVILEDDQYELDRMYRSAFEDDPGAEWNIN